MAQTLHINVDGGAGGGAVINAKLDGIQFFNAIGSAPDNLTYDNYIGSIQTNNGVLDLLVIPPATNTDTLVIQLTGAVTQNINVNAAGSTTGSGYNNFTRSIPIGEIVTPASPDLDKYFTIISGAYFSGKSIVVTDNTGGVIRVKSFPTGGKFVFNANITEMRPYPTLTQYYIVTGGSNLQRVFTGIPVLSGNSNGVYYGNLGTRDNYNGVITLTNDGAIVNRNLTFASGTWEVQGIAEPETNPYDTGGSSGTGGGNGNFDLRSDAVDFPALPTLTAVSTGLVSVYTPTLTQLNALATFLWNANPTDVDWWKKLVANPLDLILGLSIVPCAVPAGSAQNIKVGLIDTGVSVTRAATQFVEVDCGSLNVQEFWGSALDYLPFRKHSIYLPFIGTRTISTDDIMGKTVSVKYHIDLLSGACTAMVKCGDAVLYQYSGACAVSIPLTGQTFTSMITSTIQLAAGVAATVASGGAAAGVTVASAANSVMSMKPTVERAGGVSGAAGQLGIMTPYLIGEIPRQSVPENYNKFAGYPSNITAVLGDLSGFTTIETVQLQNIPATAAEYAEIEQLLKDGVIL